MDVPQPGRQRGQVGLHVGVVAVPPEQLVTAKACRLWGIPHKRH